MASIDKIYGTVEQYNIFSNWCEENIPFALEHFYDPKHQSGTNGEYIISNFPSAIDYWLIDNCPLEFVQSRLRVQYCDVYESLDAGHFDNCMHFIHEDAIKEYNKLKSMSAKYSIEVYYPQRVRVDGALFEDFVCYADNYEEVVSFCDAILEDEECVAAYIIVRDSEDELNYVYVGAELFYNGENEVESEFAIEEDGGLDFGKAYDYFRNNIPTFVMPQEHYLTKYFYNNYNYIG